MSGFWIKHRRWIPRPWSDYIACHGYPRSCHWFPPWRDAVVCRARGHAWFEPWEDRPGELMCRRCAHGPLDLEAIGGDDG